MMFCEMIAHGLTGHVRLCADNIGYATKQKKHDAWFISYSSLVLFQACE